MRSVHALGPVSRSSTKWDRAEYEYRCAEYEPEHRGMDHVWQSHLRVMRARKNGCLPAVSLRGFASEGNAFYPPHHDDFGQGGISRQSRVLRGNELSLLESEVRYEEAYLASVPFLHQEPTRYPRRQQTKR